jgi:hypothetical protein
VCACVCVGGGGGRCASPAAAACLGSSQAAHGSSQLAQPALLLALTFPHCSGRQSWMPCWLRRCSGSKRSSSRSSWYAQRPAIAVPPHPPLRPSARRVSDRHATATPQGQAEGDPGGREPAAGEHGAQGVRPGGAGGRQGAARAPAPRPPRPPPRTWPSSPAGGARAGGGGGAGAVVQHAGRQAAAHPRQRQARGWAGVRGARGALRQQRQRPHQRRPQGGAVARGAGCCAAAHSVAGSRPAARAA